MDENKNPLNVGRYNGIDTTPTSCAKNSEHRETKNEKKS